MSQSWLQIHWSVVVWVIAIHCFVVCLPRTLQGSRIYKIVWHTFSGASRFTHVTPTLKSLRWLPFNNESSSKPWYSYTSTLPLASQCISLCFCLYTSVVKTRRSNPEKKFLEVPFYSSSVHKSKVHFSKSFSYDAPKLWNDLLLEIRTVPTLSCSKGNLKIYVLEVFSSLVSLPTEHRPYSW